METTFIPSEDALLDEWQYIYEEAAYIDARDKWRLIDQWSLDHLVNGEDNSCELFQQMAIEAYHPEFFVSKPIIVILET